MDEKTFRKCSVHKCERLHAARGFCSSHYEQAKRGITDPKNFTPLKARPICFISGCHRPHYCKGGCRAHYDIASRFNLSIAQINQIYSLGCEVCGREGDTHIDHDHSCCVGSRSCGGCIRGGLCGECNMAIGALGDNLEGVLRAVRYLQKH